MALQGRILPPAPGRDIHQRLLGADSGATLKLWHLALHMAWPEVYLGLRYEFACGAFLAWPCVQDKAMEVRRGAEALLAELVKAFGSDVVTRAAKSELQSQALAVVAPILDRHRSATPTGYPRNAPRSQF